jgi:hypothetical protein
MALSAAVIWEVQTGGSDSANGGGFRGGAYISPPAAPSVAVNAGGSVAVGTYYCVITYNDTLGETVISGQTTVSVTSGTQTIVVTAPGVATGAVSWSVYFSTVSGGPYYPQATGLTIVTNQTITATPPTTGTQPRGVDRSLQPTAQLTINNSTVTATTTGANSNTLTFTAGYTPTGADVGNIFRATGGTNITVGVFEVVAVSGNTWTVAGTSNLTGAGGAGSAITGMMGGCFATLTPVINNYVAQNTAYVKAGTYTISVGIVFSGSITVIGYSTNRTPTNTDTPPTFDAGVASIALFTFSGASNIYVTNLNVTNSTAKTGVVGFSLTTGRFTRLSGSNMTSNAISSSGSPYVADCYFTNCGNISLSGSYPVLVRCTMVNCLGGTVINNFGGLFVDCLVIGGGTTGHYNSVIGTALYLNCVSYNAVGYAFTVSGAGQSVAYNCIVWGASGIGFNVTTGPGSSIYNCAAGGCGTNFNIGAPHQKINPITLTVNPFNNPAGNDFGLNNLPGGGALCRATSFPGAFFGLGTTVSARDLGAVQHADPPVYFAA